MKNFDWNELLSDEVIIVVGVIVGIILFLIAKGKISEVLNFAGIGTIITAFFMGPMIEFFNVKVSRPLLREEVCEIPESSKA